MTTDDQIQAHLPLAGKIAREFLNIPGLPLAEIEIEAQGALAAVARKFDPAKGDFTAYAAQAIRNSLRSLYEKQCRHHRHHAYDLDIPGDFETTATDRVHNVAQPDDLTIGTRLAHTESLAALKKAMEGLPERQQIVLTGIAEGKSYSEIGQTIGISKQAVHKIAAAAVDAVKEGLAQQGFGGIDSLGLLASIKPTAS